MDRPAPEEYQPPLRWWSHLWRLGVTLAISAVVLFGTGVDEEARRSGLWVAADVLLGAACFALVQLRRRLPLTVAVVTAAVGCVSGVAAGPATLAGASVATRRITRELVLVGLANYAAGLVYPGLVHRDVTLFDVAATAVATAAMLAWGMYIGSRRELIWTLRHRAESAEAEQALRVAQARDHERHAIAREMHDVLAHRISQISLHAGALGFRDDLSAAEMRANASLIQQKAHEALTDLRAVLGVLRETDRELLTPQPTYADVAGLVAETTAAGPEVRVRDEVRDGPPPDPVGRTAYRIVQEGLTNARKHAPAAVVDVLLSGSPGTGLSVELRNPLGFGPEPRTPGSGLGLVGLAERAALSGGRLDHSVENGTFVLRAWIPWGP